MTTATTRALVSVLTVALIAGAPFAGLGRGHADHVRGAGRCDKRAERAALGRHATGVPVVDLEGVEDDGRHVRGSQFFAGELRELRIRVRWGNVGEPIAQRIELFTPSGHLYQAFAADVDQDMMETAVPVGGTLITQYGLYGEWCL